jgi:hypothetical protein
MIFTANDYQTLRSLTFRADYPGNATARGVVEVPHGDGNVDAQKKYAHVALKYILQPDAEGRPDMAEGEYTLYKYLARAHDEARHIAAGQNVPYEFWPMFHAGALRVLYYPAGVGGHLHTDFDLFAVNLWRSHPNPGLGGGRYHIGEIGELVGLGPAEPHYVAPLPEPQLALVYFAIPDHAAVLPSGQTVGAWLDERIKRSRYSV